VLLIKNIEFIETDRDPYEIINLKSPYEAVEVLSNRGREVVSVNEIRELIRGRRFVRPSDNKDIIVGCSKKAEDVIGIQYEAWDTLEKDCQAWSAKTSKLISEISDIKKSGLFKRIKFVFTGIS